MVPYRAMHHKNIQLMVTRLFDFKILSNHVLLKMSNRMSLLSLTCALTFSHLQLHLRNKWSECTLWQLIYWGTGNCCLWVYADLFGKVANLSHFSYLLQFRSLWEISEGFYRYWKLVDFRFVFAEKDVGQKIQKISLHVLQEIGSQKLTKIPYMFCKKSLIFVFRGFNMPGTFNSNNEMKWHAEI